MVRRNIEKKEDFLASEIKLRFSENYYAKNSETLNNQHKE